MLEDTLCQQETAPCTKNMQLMERHARYRYVQMAKSFQKDRIFTDCLSVECQILSNQFSISSKAALLWGNHFMWALVEFRDSFHRR